MSTRQGSELEKTNQNLCEIILRPSEIECNGGSRVLKVDVNGEKKNL